MPSTKSNYQHTADWLAACGKKIGNQSNLDVQTGCHLEELAEFLDELIVTGSPADDRYLAQASTTIKGIAHRLKTGATGIRFRDRVGALDALCDAEVTGNGVAFLAGFNKVEGDRRVLASNDSKLNADGTAVILPGGKIGKSERYVKPFLNDLV
jgi:hypothetical protein